MHPVCVLLLCCYACVNSVPTTPWLAQCPPGTYGVGPSYDGAGEPICTPCDNGTFSSTYGSAACVPCPNTSSVNSRQTGCMTATTAGPGSVSGGDTATAIVGVGGLAMLLLVTRML